MFRMVDGQLKVPISKFDILLYNFIINFIFAELKDSYSPLKDPECKTSATVINGGQPSCIGWPILDDNFNGPTVDASKWFVHHRIPTYSPPVRYLILAISRGIILTFNFRITNLILI